MDDKIFSVRSVVKAFDTASFFDGAHYEMQWSPLRQEPEGAPPNIATSRLHPAFTHAKHECRARPTERTPGGSRGIASRGIHAY
jgi:hypothetical protein